jgi:hypothetical protein
MDLASQPSLPGQPAPQRDSLPAGAAPANPPGRAWLAIIVILIAAIVIAGVIVVVALRSPVGNVYFSKTAYDTTSGTCQFSSPVTTVSAGDRVFLVAVFTDTIQVQDDYTLEILQNGVSLGTRNVTAETKFSCYVEQSPLGPLSPGVYVFTFRHNDKIEAEGTLEVK